jgi:DNA-binding MarR family transcriptional regulator
MSSSEDQTPPSWTFFSNHGHVLLCLKQSKGMRLREVALKVGITERAVQKIVKDLETGGVITKEKVGRCNEYKIQTEVRLRHPVESHRSVGDLLNWV